MRTFQALSCLLAALSSAYTVLAESLPQQTPGPSPELMHLKPRQLNPGVNPDAATQAQQQVSPVTVYNIEVQVGAAGVQTAVTYTQLFSPVPDQWPGPLSGAIGYGGLQRREVQARATDTVTGVVVLVMETEVVTQPLQKVTQVMVVQTMAVFSNRTVTHNDTERARSGTLPNAFRTSAGGIHPVSLAAPIAN